MDVAAAVERFGVIHDFLHDVEACEGIDVDKLFPFLRRFVGGIYGVVDGIHLLREKLLLLRGKNLGRVIGDAQRFAVAFGEFYLCRIVVVVDFGKPAAGDVVGGFVEHLKDVHTVLGYANVFGEHIQSAI